MKKETKLITTIMTRNKIIARKKLDIKKSNVEVAEKRMKDKITQLKGRKI